MKTPHWFRPIGGLLKHAGLGITLLVIIAVILAMRFSTPDAVQARMPAGPHIYLQESHEVPTTHAGPAGALATLASGQAEALSLASADFDQDGIADLLVGYSTPQGGILALHRGNLDAFAPQSPESFQAITEGRFPSPFLESAQVFSLAARPDFLATGHFTDAERFDFVVAAQGTNRLYLYAGSGNGQFSPPATISLPGMVTSVASGKFGPASQFTRLLVGVQTAGGKSSLIVFSGSVSGLSKVSTHPLAAPATSIEFGQLDADLLADAVLVAGGDVVVLHGTSDIAGTLETLSLPLSATSVIAGRFVHDRDPRLQIAVLSPDGTVHIAAHSGFDPRAWTAEELKQMRRSLRRGGFSFFRAGSPDSGWKIVESFTGMAPSIGSSAPVMVRSRISSKAADDVTVLNGEGSEMAVLSHPNLPLGATSLLPGQASTRPYAAGVPVAALSMRVNIDGRPGIVVLHRGQLAPSVMEPLPDPTFNVNTTSDTVDANPGDGICADSQGHCSLRAAIMEANATPGVDTIMVPAGTYTLTVTGIDEDAAATGDLDITDGVNIVGAGSSTTIIQAGTTASNGIDKVFSINPNGLSNSFDTSLSNLTIRFGRNTSANSPFGGGFDWDAGTSGTGNLSITSSVISNNSTTIAAGGLTFADGGGFFASNEIGNTGTVTISGTTIQNNSAADDGGGIFVGANIPFTLTNSQVLSNSAVGGGDQNGGGMLVFGPSGATQSAVHNSTISSNHAGSNGGGIYTTEGILVDQGSVINGNQASGNGGGIWDNAGETVTLSKITITANSAVSSGGAIQVDNNTTSNNLSVSFTRISGNTAGTGSGINNVSGTVSAADNWWGCNQGPSLSPCDRVSGAVTFSPWITLTHTASPSAINSGDLSTLTASLLQDSNNAALAAANLSAFTGVPVTFNNAINGTLSGCQTAIQSSGTATCSFTGTAAGTGQADAHLDQATVTASLTVRDFTISVSPASKTVSVGSGTTYTVTVSPLSGFTSSVCLSVNNTLPTGVTASFSPSCISGGSGTSTLTVNTSSSAAAGNPTITVKGVAGNDNHLASPVTLQITDFTITATPASQTINVTASTSYTVTISPVNGFTGSVCLSLLSPPTGVSGTFTPSCVSGGSGISTLNITTINSAVGGSFTLNINGLSGNDSHTTSKGLVLMDFSVAVSPSTQPVNAGACVNYTVTVSAIQGFTGSVALTLNSPPSGVSATFSPATVTGGAGTSTMNVCASTSAVAQADSLTMKGTSGAITRNSPAFTLNVRDFTISATPSSQTVTAGHGTTYTVTVSPLNGFNSSVCLSFTSALTTGITGSFSPSCITGGSGASTLTMNTVNTVATGAYTIPITGNASPPAHNISVTLNVSGMVTLRPTVATANGIAYANPANAEDGNLSTFASGTVAASMSGEIWSGFGSVGFTPSSLTLKISSAANCGDPNDGIELAYSLDGGNTYNFGYIMGLFGGACVNRPQQTDVITLPTNQNLANVKVLAIFYSPAGSSSHQVYDAWIEAMP